MEEATEEVRENKTPLGRPKKTKPYINVSRGRLYTGIKVLMSGGKKVKTMGILFPRDWVGDVLPRHGAKKMELTPAQAEPFGDKVVATG